MGRLDLRQCAAGDFTGDGYPDLVGLDLTRQRLNQTNPMSRLRPDPQPVSVRPSDRSLSCVDANDVL
ncbi:MAG: FG-GAP repeat protein [Ignavibacteriales bacterium]|nr:FG-GAP repeat protein [Ignavibacteriales bacterium]